jgi:hypothetical protein
MMSGISSFVFSIASMPLVASATRYPRTQVGRIHLARILIILDDKDKRGF